MRDYQTKMNQGAAADSITDTKYGAGEFNSLADENETAVSRTGLTLAGNDGSGEDPTQLAQALLINGTSASTFQAGGFADAITLTPVTGSNGLLLPPNYDTLDGMRVNFVVALNNTAAVTMSIGQDSGSQFVPKKVLNSSAGELTADSLVQDTRVEAVFDSTLDGGSGAWILTPWSGSSSQEQGTIPLDFDSGTNAILASASVGFITAYEDGVIYTLNVGNTTTASVVTLNVDNVGSREIRRDHDENLAIGQIEAHSTIPNRRR